MLSRFRQSTPGSGSARSTGALKSHSVCLRRFMYALKSILNLLTKTKPKTMKTTLIDNWKTSLVGLALIGAGLYTGLTAKQNWTESGPVILAGTGLIFSKDAKK